MVNCPSFFNDMLIRRIYCVQYKAVGNETGNETSHCNITEKEKE